MRATILKALSISATDRAKGQDLLSTARDFFAKADKTILQSANYVVFAPGEAPWSFAVEGLNRLSVENAVLDLSQPDAVKKIDD